MHSQTAGSFGQTAGGFGSTAGSTGQTAGSFGKNAGSTSQTAGSVGKDPGSFGESLSTLASAAAAANGSSAIAAKLDAAWEGFAEEVRGGVGLDVTYEDVGADEIQARLDAVAGTAEAPDVLVGTPLPTVWSEQNTGLVRQYGLVTLGLVNPIPQTESPERRTVMPEASILVRAPHPRSAREFVKWLSDRATRTPRSRAPVSVTAPVRLAKSALVSVLYGGEIGGVADRQMAAFNSQAAQQAAMAVYGSGLLDGLRVDVGETSVSANERFAAVELRAVMESRAGFGVAHAVVVLRVDETTGQWRVLQLTPNLTVEQQQVAWQTVGAFGFPVKREEVAQVVSASLAAPVDGDNRPPVPELWWDNKGTGTLEVVEWQRSFGNSWTGSNMYFVPEDTGHLRTRATGRFANSPGVYRWRVWSLGKGGTVALSSWRSVNILSQ